MAINSIDDPRLSDDDRDAVTAGGIALQGVPSGDDLSHLIQTFEELGRGTVPDSDHVLACLKELQQRRAASPMQGVPVGEQPGEPPSATPATDRILAGLAVFDCYIDTIPDERAKDRYVLWAARDKFEDAYEIVQALPSRLQPQAMADASASEPASDEAAQDHHLPRLLKHWRELSPANRCEVIGYAMGLANPLPAEPSLPPADQGSDSAQDIPASDEPADTGQDNDSNGLQRFMRQTLLKLWQQLTYEQRTNLLNVATKWVAEPESIEDRIESKPVNPPQGSLLALLNDIRREVEQSRATTACVTGALFHMNMGVAEEAATTLQAYVDNALCVQVDKLDEAIEIVQPVVETAHA